MALENVAKLFDLSERVALITGASSWGIGSASAKLLAEAGAKVFLVARREDKLKERAAEIEAAGGTAAYFACDVAEEENCKQAVEACLEAFGQLDILVLSQGISGLSARDHASDFDTENYRRIMGINLDGCWWMMKYAHEHCAKGGRGSIVVISSLGAYNGMSSGSYTATKGALRSMTTHFGRTFAADGLRFNTVYPGFIDTDMTHPGFSHEDYAPMFLRQVPLGRFGTGEDVANMVLFLASDASSWVTGQNFIVDGGQLSKWS